MLFSTVSFPEYIEDVENKLRLNLSAYAFSILNNDLESFQDSEINDKTIPSFFLNHIFSLYRDAARSSISLAIDIKRSELTEILKGLPESERAVEKLLIVYEKELSQESQSRLKERGKPFSIRVNKENLEYLRSKDGQAEGKYYNDKVGLYFKAVIEEYCRLSYVARERIFCRDNWNEAIRAINEEKVLRLKLKSQRKGKNNIQYMRLVCIDTDSEHMYNYLAGMIGATQSGPWKPGAIRLSSVQEAKRQEKSGHLTEEEKKNIKSEIKKRGIQYLSDRNSIDKIVVVFTPKGEKMYNSMLHLRPAYKSKKDLEYEFECSLSQAEFYFFKFGYDVKILEPDVLAEKFKRKYQLAAKQYE